MPQASFDYGPLAEEGERAEVAIRAGAPNRHVWLALRCALRAKVRKFRALGS